MKSLFTKKTSETAGTQHGSDYAVKENKYLNIAIKIISLIAAIFIWIYAIGADSPYYERTFSDITVKIENIPENMSVIWGGDSVVDITVRGRRSDVQSLTNENIKLYADASSVLETDTYQLEIVAALPNGITLQEISKNTVSVHIGTSSQKTVDVSASLINFDKPSDAVLNPVLTVKKITVEGPEDELEKIAYAKVVIDVGTIRESKTMNGKILLFDVLGNEYSNPYVTQSAKETDVNIFLLGEKEIKLDVGCKYGYFTDDNTKITITPSTIKISGEYSLLSQMDSLNIHTFDETQILQISDYETSVPVSLPDSITLKDDISEIKIQVSHINTAVKEFMIPCENIVLGGANPNYSYSYDKEFITVKLRGENILDFLNMSTDDITAYIGVNGYSEGTALLPVNIQIKDTDFLVYTLGEYSLNVTIQKLPQSTSNNE